MQRNKYRSWNKWQFPDLAQPPTACSSTRYPASPGLVICICKLLSKNVEQRVSISDHRTQWETRICLLAVIALRRVLRENQFLPTGYASPVQLFHSSDKSHNEREFIGRFLGCEALRYESIRNFCPASALSFTELHSVWFVSPGAFVVLRFSRQPGYTLRMLARKADTYLGYLAFMVG